MAQRSKEKKEPETAPLVIIYTRIRADDFGELKAREAATGATIAAQVRILIHEGLTARKVIR
jgi:hypothetical protein